MVVSLGASLLLYGLDEEGGQGGRGLENQPFPEEVTRDSVLTWCAGLRYSSPPDEEGTIVEIRPSTRNLVTANRIPPRSPAPPRPGRSSWSRATRSPARDPGCRPRKREFLERSRRTDG